MATWTAVAAEIAKTGAKNVRIKGDTLLGNDGLILTYNPQIAAGYVKADWDAINCRPGR